MKFPRKNFLYLLAIALLSFACQNDDKGDEVTPDVKGANNVMLHFEHKFGNENLKLMHKYQAANDTIMLHELRYYISNVKLGKRDGSEYTVPYSYYLLEVKQDADKKMVLKDKIMLKNIPDGSCNKITYSLGVDSLHNHDLTMKKGDLSEKIGMSWTWKTGYIFFKMEGMTATKHNNSADIIAYMIHGGTDAAYQTRSLDIPQEMSLSNASNYMIHSEMKVDKLLSANATSGVTLHAQDTTILNGKPMVSMMGGKGGVAKVLSNYADLFHIHHIEKVDELHENHGSSTESHDMNHSGHNH